MLPCPCSPIPALVKRPWISRTSGIFFFREFSPLFFLTPKRSVRLYRDLCFVFRVPGSFTVSKVLGCYLVFAYAENIGLPIDFPSVGVILKRRWNCRCESPIESRDRIKRIIPHANSFRIVWTVKIEIHFNILLIRSHLLAACYSVGSPIDLSSKIKLRERSKQVKHVIGAKRTSIDASIGCIEAFIYEFQRRMQTRFPDISKAFITEDFGEKIPLIGYRFIMSEKFHPLRFKYRYP